MVVLWIVSGIHASWIRGFLLGVFSASDLKHVTTLAKQKKVFWISWKGYSWHGSNYSLRLSTMSTRLKSSRCVSYWACNVPKIHVRFWWDHANINRQELHEHLTRYIKLRVVHGPEMPGTFSQPPTGGNRSLAIPTCITARACRDR